MATVSCIMKLDYDGQKKAEAVAKALEPDNERYIEVDVKDCSIHCYAEADNPLSLLHTLDDFLACLTVAEETLGIKK